MAGRLVFSSGESAVAMPACGIMTEDPPPNRHQPIRPPDLPQVAVAKDPPRPMFQEPEITPANPAAPHAPVQVKIREAHAKAVALVDGDTAPFNTRVVAAVIDVVIASGLMMAASWVLPSFAEKIGWLLGVGYLITRDSVPFLNGRSIGKTAMKLKVVTLDDQNLIENWELAIRRNALLVVPGFALVELFVLLSREDQVGHGIRLGDEWAKTKVVVVVEQETDSN